MQSAMTGLIVDQCFLETEIMMLFKMVFREILYPLFQWKKALQIIFKLFKAS
jgi:hypothetical protein